MIGNLDEGLPIFSKNIARSFDSAMFVYGIQNRFLRGINFKYKSASTREIACRGTRLSMLYKKVFLTREKTNKKTKVPQRAKLRVEALDWWELVDSNHRSMTQQIYSLSPLATRESSHIFNCCSIKKMELVDGFEPPTC